MKKLTLNQIYAELDPKDEYLMFVKEAKIAFVHDEDGHTLRVYKIESEYPLMFKDITPDFKGMALKLAEGLNVEALLEDLLKSKPLETTLEVAARLEHPEASVKSKEGCFKLLIGGKPGRPIELDIIS